MTSKISRVLDLYFYRLLFVFALIGGLLGAAGCSIVGQPIAEEVADVVVKYCAGEPYQARQLYRQTINAELAGEGHSIAVTCAGDPQE